MRSLDEAEQAAAPPAVLVVVDGPTASAWQAEALQRVLRSAHVGSVGVRFAPTPRAGGLSRLHRALDRRLIRLGRDPLAPAHLDAGAALDAPDITLWLASAPPEGTRGDLIVLRYGPAAEDVAQAFRRALGSGAHAVAAEARCIHDGADAGVLARGVSAVRRYSLAAGVDAALWRSAVLAARAVERWAAGGATEVAPPAPRPAAAPFPGSLLARAAASWVRVLSVRLLYRRPWSILLRERGSGEPWGWADAPVAWSPGHTYADPFLFERDGRHHLFCEHVRPGTGRGVISHVELATGEAKAPPPVPVLETAEHLSYPFVVEHEGEVYLIPETASARQIRLYRAVSFPDRWELDRVLVDDIVAVDTTLVEANGRWWMFTSPGPPGATLGEELHLFCADSPLGPWRAHPANPVVGDIRGGRSAGALFSRDGRLFRPAQDGSRRYGWAISVREVVTLSDVAYEEREVGRIEPGDIPGARAVHTYACDGRYEAIDARRRERRWSPGARRA